MVLGVKRRGHHRAKIKCTVLIRTASGWMVGKTLNISPTGVLVSCTEPLRVNELFELVIEAYPPGSPLSLTAQVVWSAIYGRASEFYPHLVGMRFTKISAKDRSLICTMVSEHLKQGGLGIVRNKNNSKVRISKSATASPNRVLTTSRLLNYQTVEFLLLNL